MSLLTNPHSQFNCRSLLLAAVATLMLSACSVRMTYNYLDWLIPWYADDYVSLSERQEKLFERATMQLLGWHRSNELPRYADFLNRIRADLDVELTQPQVIEYFDEGRALWKNLLGTSMPALLELAKSLSDEQVNELVTSLADDIQDIEDKEKDLDDAERREKWRDNMDDALDDWLGSVNQQQTKLLAKWSEERLNTYTQWITYRKAWHSRFSALLQKRDSDQFDAEFTSLLLDPDQLRDEAYRLQTQKNRNQFAQLLADISLTLSDRQRTHLIEKLDELAGDLKELSEQID